MTSLLFFCSSDILIINDHNFIMNSNSIKSSKEKSSLSSDYLIEPPKKQAQLQQKYVHLQTILILAQFNSTYYELNLSIKKAFSKLQKKYYLLRVMAFERIKAQIQPIYFSPKQAKFYYLASKFSIQEDINNQLINNNANKTVKKTEDFSLRAFSAEQTRIKYTQKIKGILQNIFKLIQRKQSNFIYYSYFKIVKYSNQSSILKFLSEKSTKIETTDSQKSKLLRRSVEKQSNRKSFSMQKSINRQKHQYFIPVKYQPSNKIPLNASRQSQPQNKQSGSSSTISIKYYNSQQNAVRSRRNIMDFNRQRNGIKCSSNTKYNTSSISGGQRKIEKVVELDLLHKKYKKLISQFNSFSEKFLKVIQEEEV